MVNRLRHRSAVLAAAALAAVLAGCAPPFPKELRATVDTGVSFSALKADAERYRGRTVMFGGIIAATRNTGEGTFIEIVQTDLDRSGRPRLTDESGGRFLVRTEEFLDAAVYAPGRLLTVIGDTAGTRVQKLEAIDYSYPLVTARALHLWKPRDGGPRCHIGIGIGKSF